MTKLSQIQLYHFHTEKGKHHKCDYFCFACTHAAVYLYHSTHQPCYWMCQFKWAPETFKKKHNTIQASLQDLAKKVPVKHKLLKFLRKRVASSLSKDQNNMKHFYLKIKVWFLRIISGFWATKWLKTHLDNKNKKQQSLRAFFFFLR